MDYQVSPTLPLLLGFGLPNTQFINLHNPVLESSYNSVLLSNKSLRYLLTHIRFSSPSYMTALVDIFSYEVRNSSSLVTTLNSLTKTDGDIKAVNLTFNTLLSDLVS